MTVHDDDVVTLEGLGVCAVVSTAGRPLVTLRLPDGGCIRMGERVIEQLRVDGPNSASATSARGRGGYCSILTHKVRQ